MKTAELNITSTRETTANGAGRWNPPAECCDSERVDLRRGQLRSWKRARVGTTIRAREGAVWVTQEGDRRDVILSAGECFRVTRAGRVIAEALRDSALLVIGSTH
jgi:hypothetical protein